MANEKQEKTRPRPQSAKVDVNQTLDGKKTRRMIFLAVFSDAFEFKLI
jgi:hypothetical protein